MLSLRSPLSARHLLALGAFLIGSVSACDCGGGLGGSTCTSTADCPTGFVCLDGLCRDRDTGDAGPPTSCISPADCDPGLSCVSGRCVDDPGCVDPDGDGFGEGCTLGPDCDEGNPTQTGREVCDGMDNDCDGEADNGVLSPCGDCNPDCEATGRGPGSEMPFDPEMDDSEGVGLDDEGAIVLDSREVPTDFIWIANTPQGTVSRFSTTAPYPETGRFVTGPASSNDPSRTSVNSSGDVYVGNRGGGSVSRISVLGAECPDTNGDGIITTSSSGDFLPWGQDDCVLWNRELPGSFIRAVAAQDVVGPDGELEEYVWIGGWNSNTVYKLDGRTGEVLFTTPAPVQTYGFALDASGNLWISGIGGSLGRIDTNRCIDEASCAAPACGADGDDCVKQVIPLPTPSYGITVDFMQRVWLGGHSGSSTIKRYDPSAPLGSRFLVVGRNGTHGIAADAVGFVWAAGQGGGVYRVDAVTGDAVTVTGTEGASNKGIAVDSEGKVWSITQSPEAIVITPGPTLGEYTVERGVASSIVNPYTYSDMTGLQLRLATNPRGYYRAIFEGCPETLPGDTEWGDLAWEAETPAGTSVVWRARTAATRDALDSADWVTLATVPPDSSPVNIGAAFMDAGVEIGRWLMIEAQLTAERTSTTEVITPRVLAIDVQHVCPPDFG